GRPRNMESTKVITTFLTLAAAAVMAASDTTTYVVLNHGRGAGGMIVVTAGDSTVVRWIFVDRNRGTRVETRYRYAADGHLLSAESRPIAANGQAGDPMDAFEVHGDSVRWVPAAGRGGGGGRGGRGGGAGGTPVSVKMEPGAYLGLRGGSPYEAAALANFLLKQPKFSAKILPGGDAHAEIAGEATVPTNSGRTHVRLV